jgi:hypothetical protein
MNRACERKEDENFDTKENGEIVRENIEGNGKERMGEIY